MRKKIAESYLTLAQGDITKEETDALVNAANPSLLGGGGVDGAIHRAGGPAILEECKKIRKERGKLPPGEAVATTAGALKAKYVIHTVGPVWRGGKEGEEEVLENCYLESLKIAVQKGCRSVAFPSISTGAYGYPVEKAARVALRAVVNFLKERSEIEEVRFVLFDSQTFSAYREALEELT
jgi:O-acetyl-ADP-ribose deacetylase (regulator of RNase III)